MEGSLATREGAAVGVVVASEGYPDAPAVGRRLTGAEPSTPADDGDVLVFHAGTRRGGDGGYESAGGRVVTVVGRGSDHEVARTAAYGAVVGVLLEGAQYRTDVAARELRAADEPQTSGIGRTSATSPGERGS
jgi:phosphoribosylamine--glycine ligase